MPRRQPFSFASFDMTVQAPMREAFVAAGDLPRAMQDILAELARPHDSSLTARLDQLKLVSALTLADEPMLKRP